MDRDIIPYQLLAKYFANECTASEIKELTGWIDSSDGNSLLFSEFKHVWEEPIRSQTLLHIPNRENVWKNIKISITQKNKNIKTLRQFRHYIIASFIAVTITITCSLSYLYSFIQNTKQNELTTFIVPSGQKAQLVLPDSTSLWLNSNSRLSYFSDYNYKYRKVSLTGEAFFEVKKNNKIPFIVELGEIDIQVHGTTFNVHAYTDKNVIQIALLEGSISIYSSNHKLISLLNPGEAIHIKRDDMTYVQKLCDSQFEGIWRLNQLKLENNTATDVWKKIGCWYGVNISVQNTKPKLTYWITVKMESLKELLEIINKVTPIDYNINGKEVTIRYQ